MRSSHFGSWRHLVIVVVLLIAPVSLATACFDPIPDDTILPPGTGRLRGTIRDACDEKVVLGGVRVTIDAISTQTDSQGQFTFDALAAGLHQVQVAHKGYETIEKSVQIDDGRETSLEVDLLPQVTTLPSSPLLDVLFVVDNSGSMAQEQAGLTRAFPAFISELRAANVNLHIGVISTDMGAGSYALPSCWATGGDGGVLQVEKRIAGCSGPASRWIAAYGEQSNVAEGSVEDAFSCIATLGIYGCGFEQPLAAILRALDDPTGVNGGFIRKEASLAIIVITDEDDCSAKDPSLFDPRDNALTGPLGPLTSFRCFEFGVRCDINDRAKPGPRHDCVPSTKEGYLVDVHEVIAHLEQVKGVRPLFFALLGGPTSPVSVSFDGKNPTLSPSCQTSMGFAVPAIRLHAVVDAFAPRSSFDSICADDFTPALRSIAKKIVATALLNACATP